jgi:hypothetical protein
MSWSCKVESPDEIMFLIVLLRVVTDRRISSGKYNVPLRI